MTLNRRSGRSKVGSRTHRAARVPERAKSPFRSSSCRASPPIAVRLFWAIRIPISNVFEGLGNWLPSAHKSVNIGFAP